MSQHGDQTVSTRSFKRLYHHCSHSRSLFTHFYERRLLSEVNEYEIKYRKTHQQTSLNVFSSVFGLSMYRSAPTFENLSIKIIYRLAVCYRIPNAVQRSLMYPQATSLASHWGRILERLLIHSSPASIKLHSSSATLEKK